MHLQLADLNVVYGSGARTVHAVRDLSLTIEPGETLAVVGESGCGKSTTAAVVAGLLPPTSGTVIVDGTPLTDRRRKPALKRKIQMVFQHSDQALDRRWSVERAIAEPLRHLTDLDRSQRAARVREVLADVRLDDTFLDRTPRTLSGGQAQRVAIARALACRPELVVLDEPTASLDHSVRGTQLRLLQRLQHEHGLSYLLITHDISSVQQIADRVVVMYRGSVMETGTTTEVLSSPAHPYTRALIGSILVADPTRRVTLAVRGEVTPADDHERGCPFAPRCAHVDDACRATIPLLVRRDGRRSVACIRADDLP